MTALVGICDALEAPRMGTFNMIVRIVRCCDRIKCLLDQQNWKNGIYGCAIQSSFPARLDFHTDQMMHPRFSLTAIKIVRSVHTDFGVRVSRD